jgi:hypothetical protein
MLGAKLEVIYNAKDANIGNHILKKLGSFPPSIWFEIEKELRQLASTRAAEIGSHSVAPATYKWRKAARKRSGAGGEGVRGGEWSGLVETYNGTFSEVNDSHQLGDRTGTFIKDYSDSREPGVTMAVGTHLAGRGVVQNGSFSYKINADEFANEYPRIFQDYLIGKGIIPDDGYLSLDEGREEQLLNSLGEAAWRQIQREVGTPSSAAMLGNKIIVNVRKLIGKFFRR